MKSFIYTVLIFLYATIQAFAGTFYLTDGDSSNTYLIDLPSGNYLGSFTTFQFGYPIAVADTVRIGNRDNNTGYEYNLNGSPTGVSFTGTGGISQLLDGTTDGTTYNYGVTCCGSNAVYRGDRFWLGLTSIFTLPAGGSGITYDPQDESLWVSMFDGTIREYSLTGTELFSFNAPNTPAALAYDASLDSFWYIEQGRQTFVNFDRLGNQLNSLTVAGLPGNNAWGGDMAMSSPVPEPGALLLAFSGLAAVLLRRKLR